MYEDDFGCLHTKDIFGHKMRVYPFAKKYPFTCLCSAQCGLIVPLWLRTTFGGKKAFFPRSLQQGPKGAQRMMKGCSKVAYAFVTLLITYSLFFCRKLLYDALCSSALHLTASPLLLASTPRLPHAVHNRTTARKLAFPIS